MRKILFTCLLAATSGVYANVNVPFTPNFYVKSKISEAALKGPIASQEKLAASAGFNSNSSNFASMFTGSVDGRTGNYSMSINFGYALANSGAGPTYPLKLSYSTSNKIDIGFGKGWALNLTHYDPNTNTLSLGSGGSYHILWENNKPVLEYQKIKDLVISTSTDKSILFNLAFKDGHKEVVDIFGDIVTYENPMGRKLFFNYDKNRSLHILDSITDKSKRVLQHIDYLGNKVISHSLHAADKDYAVTIYLNNSYLTRIEEGSTDHNISLSYGANTLISTISSSLGSSTQFRYTTLNGPGLEKVPAIAEETVNPGFSQPTMDSTYKYSLENGHNYLGYSAGVQYKKGVDNLYLRPTNYDYQTSVSRNAGTTVITKYNKFNLILNQQLMESTSGVKLLQLDYTYPKWQSMTLSQLSPSYAYATSIVEHSFNSNGDESAPIFTHQHFDDQGNLISQSDINYYKKLTTYGKTDSNGFNTSIISSKLEALDPTDKILPTVNNTFKYIDLKGIPLPTSSESKTLYKGVLLNDEFKYTKYYTDPLLKDYGLKKSTYSNKGEGDFKKTNYSYEFNKKITVLGVTYNTNVTTASKPNALNPPLVNKYYIDVLTGRQVLGIDPQGYKSTRTYYDDGRLKSFISNMGTPKQVVVNYTYDGNYIIVGSPNGTHSKVLTDGLGRKIKLYKEATLNGNYVPNKWDLVTTWNYTSTGKIDSTTNYGQKVLPVTLTYLFDRDNNSIGQVSSLGQASIGIIDPINNIKINYSLIANKSISGISICHIGSSAFSCKAIALKVTARNPKTRDLTGIYNLVLDPNIKDDNGNFIYPPTLKSQLATHIANDLDKGQRFNDTWLKSWIVKVIAAKAYYTSTTTTYNKYHLLLSSTNSDNVTTTYTYNDYNQKITKSTAGRLTTIYHYNKNHALDAIGFKSKEGKDIYLGHRTYNKEGQLISSTDVRGYKKTYSYNKYGLLTNVLTPNGNSIQVVYNKDGTIAQRKTPDSSISYKYDNEGRVIQAGSLAYVYNQDGTVASIGSEKFSDFRWSRTPRVETDKNGDVYTNTYDKYGHLTSALINGKVVLKRSFDINGGHVVLTTDNGNLTTYGTNDDVALPKSLTVAYKGQAKIKIAYTHYRDGRLKTKSRNDGSKEYVKSYIYDNLGNLLRYSCSGSLCPSDSHDNVVKSQSYTFDDVNNIKTLTSIYANGNSNTTTYFYSKSDPVQLTHYTNSDATHGDSYTITYDKDGNVISDDIGNKFIYDSSDRISSMTDPRGKVYKYTYDDAGDLLQRGNIKYSYGLAGLEAINDNGKITKYIKDIGSIAVIEPDNKILYNISGLRNAVIGRVTQSGVLVQEYTYTPYGDRSPEGRSYSDFNGNLADKSTNISMMGRNPGRAYSPVFKRFMSRDSSSPFSSGGINAYLFVTNDPVNKTDSSGHVPAWLSQMGLVGSIAGAILSAPMLITPLAPLAVIIDAGVGVGIANHYIHGNNGLTTAALVMGHINNVIYAGLGFGALSIGAATVNAMREGTIAVNAINVVSAAGDTGGASIGLLSIGTSEVSSILRTTKSANAGTLDVLDTLAAGSGMVSGLVLLPSLGLTLVAHSSVAHAANEDIPMQELNATPQEDIQPQAQDENRINEPAAPRYRALSAPIGAHVDMIDTPAAATPNLFGSSPADMVFEITEDADQFIPFSKTRYNTRPDSPIELEPMYIFNGIDMDNLTDGTFVLDQYQQNRHLNEQPLMIVKKDVEDADTTSMVTYDNGSQRESVVVMDYRNNLLHYEQNEVVLGWRREEDQFAAYSINPNLGLEIFNGATETGTEGDAFGIYSTNDDEMFITLQPNGNFKYPVVFTKEYFTDGATGDQYMQYVVASLNVPIYHFTFFGMDDF